MRPFAVLLLMLAAGVLLLATCVAWGVRGLASFLVPGAIGCVLAAWLFWAAWRLDLVRVRLANERRHEQARAAQVAARHASDVALANWRTGQTLVVPGVAWCVPVAVLTIAVGAFLLFVGALAPLDNAVLLLVGASLFVAGLWAASRMLPTLGKPALEISAQGVVVPLYGRLAWHDVMGICVRNGTSRDGQAVNFRVLFKLADVKCLRGVPHWTDRLLRWLRRGPLVTGVVTTGICPLSADPVTVEVLARRLWREATGRDHPWFPGMSDASMHAARRQGELLARVMQRTAAIETRAATAVSPDEWAAIERDMRELERETETFAAPALARPKPRFRR